MENLNRAYLCILFCGILLASVLGCDVSSDNGEDTEEFNFDAVIAGESWEGTSLSRIFNGELRIRGDENNDSVDGEFIFFRMAEFEGEGTYPIYNIGYSVIFGGDASGSFGSSADTAGTATITAFNDSLNVVEGAFDFEITASIDFDGVKDGEKFTVTGKFRSEIDTTSN